MLFDMSRASLSDRSQSCDDMEGKSGNQGVILLNKRLNLPFTGASSLIFILQNTGTSRLGYILLVLQSYTHGNNESWGFPHDEGDSPWYSNCARTNEPVRRQHQASVASDPHLPSLDHLMWLGQLMQIKPNQNIDNTCRGLHHKLQKASVLGRSSMARPGESRPMSVHLLYTQTSVVECAGSNSWFCDAVVMLGKALSTLRP